MNDIETRIRNRTYQSPGRARAGINRSLLTKNEKARMNLLVDAWEAEASAAPVIGGLPAESQPETEPLLVDALPQSNGQARGPVIGRLVPAPVASGRAERQVEPFTMNLNTRIRARLTLQGLAKLYSKRAEVAIPSDLVAHGGVWTTELWQFMAVMSGTSPGEDPLTVDNGIEIVELWT